MWKVEEGCRICSGRLETTLNLGELYLSNFVDSETDSCKAPLVLTKCQECGLVQLRDTVDLDLMYRQYWYKSSLNNSMVSALQNVVSDTLRRVTLLSDDIVIDIGANDGTMLEMFPEWTYRVGIDPAYNLQQEAEGRCDLFINDYFSVDSLPSDIPNAKVITSIAMFYDLPDPPKFVADIKSILDREGIWVIQMTDLLNMLKINAFDNICHEHLEYYSLKVIKNLLDSVGLEIFDISYNDTNGGSVRLYVAHKGVRQVEAGAESAFEQECKYLNSFTDPIRAFAERVKTIRIKVLNFFEHSTDRLIYTLGASTKGNTTLQYFNLGSQQLKFALEVNKDKFFKKTVGSGIDIIPERYIQQGYVPMPDYLFVLPWHFEKMFVEKYDWFLKSGGGLIFPMPEPNIITEEGRSWL